MPGGKEFLQQAVKTWAEEMTRQREAQKSFDDNRREQIAKLQADLRTDRKFEPGPAGEPWSPQQQELWNRSVQADFEHELPEELQADQRPRMRGIFPLKDKFLSDVECVIAVAALRDGVVENQARPGLLVHPEKLLNADPRWIYPGIWTDLEDIGIDYQLQIELAREQTGSNDELVLMDAMQRVEDCFKQKSPKRRRSKRTGAPTSKPLTAIQTEAIALHGECEGNIAEVARRMGIGRKTAQQHLDVAWDKLGTKALKPGKTKSIPTDKRGQESITEKTDKRR